MKDIPGNACEPSNAETTTVFILVVAIGLGLGVMASSGLRNSGIDDEVRLSIESRNSIQPIIEDFQTQRLALGSTPRIGLGPGLSKAAEFTSEFRRAKNSLCTHGSKMLLIKSVKSTILAYNAFVSKEEYMSSILLSRSDKMIEDAQKAIDKCSKKQTYLSQ